MGSGASAQAEPKFATGPQPTEFAVASISHAEPWSPPPDFGTFDRLHFHLLDGSDLPNEDTAFGESDPFVKVTPVLGAVPSPLTETESYPAKIHVFKSKVKTNTANPCWNRLGTLLYPRGEGATTGFQVVLADKDGGFLRGGADDVLLDHTFDVPGEHGAWHEASVAVKGGGGKGTLRFRYRTSAAEDKIVSRAEMDAFAFEERVLELTKSTPTAGGGAPKAVLQYRVSPGRNKALLWLHGRCDAFMHPHVGKVFEAAGFDIFVLNTRNSGACVKRGHLESGNPYLMSHPGPGANFDEFSDDEIAQALAIIHAPEGAGGKSKYRQTLGYAHSTGGIVLINHLIEKGDEGFDGFVFNSPFLDWGMGGLAETLLESAAIPVLKGLCDLGAKASDDTLPKARVGLPNAWALKLRSQIEYDPSTRPVYGVPVTLGFAMACNKCFAKFEKRGKDAAAPPVTMKPFLCITSRQDDVLDATDTLGRIDWLGPRRTEVEIPEGGHDVTLSTEPEIVESVLGYLRTWLASQGFSAAAAAAAGKAPGPPTVSGN